MNEEFEVGEVVKVCCEFYSWTGLGLVTDIGCSPVGWIYEIKLYSGSYGSYRGWELHKVKQGPNVMAGRLTEFKNKLN